MRYLLALVALFACLAPAHAGTRIVYDAKDDRVGLLGSETDHNHLWVEVADDGRVRIDGADGTKYGLLIGDDFYLVYRKDDAWKVVRDVDLKTVVDKMFEAEGVSPPALPFDPMSGLRIEMHDQVEVKGIKGRQILLHVTEPGARSGIEEGSFVIGAIAEDPTLTPAGRALIRLIDTCETIGRPFNIDESPDLGREQEFALMRRLFLIGPPLLWEGQFRLERVEKAAIDPKRFELPAKPQTIDGEEGYGTLLDDLGFHFDPR